MQQQIDILATRSDLSVQMVDFLQALNIYIADITQKLMAFVPVFPLVIRSSLVITVHKSICKSLHLNSVNTRIIP